MASGRRPASHAERIGVRKTFDFGGVTARVSSNQTYSSNCCGRLVLEIMALLTRFRTPPPKGWYHPPPSTGTKPPGPRRDGPPATPPGGTPLHRPPTGAPLPPLRDRP